MTPRRASSFEMASAMVGPKVFSIGLGSSCELRAMMTWPGPSAAHAHVLRPAPSNLGGACTLTLILAADTLIEQSTAAIATTAPASLMCILGIVLLSNRGRGFARRGARAGLRGVEQMKAAYGVIGVVVACSVSVAAQ